MAGKQIERHVFRRRTALGQHRTVSRQNANDRCALFAAHRERMRERDGVIDHQAAKPERGQAKPKSRQRQRDAVLERQAVKSAADKTVVSFGHIIRHIGRWQIRLVRRHMRERRRLALAITKGCAMHKLRKNMERPRQRWWCARRWRVQGRRGFTRCWSRWTTSITPKQSHYARNFPRHSTRSAC